MKVKMQAIAGALCAVGLMGASFGAWAADAPTDPATIKQIAEAVKKLEADNGVEFYGYMRAGVFGDSNEKNNPRSQYSLSGDSGLQLFRLGNESDQYLAFGMKKKFDFGDGVKANINWKPEMWYGPAGQSWSTNTIKTALLSGEISGLSFAPEVTFWAGQKGHGKGDIHILDRDMIIDDAAVGAGADGINVGSAKADVGIWSTNKIGGGVAASAKRMNGRVYDINTNTGGKLTVTAAVGSGGGLVKKDNDNVTSFAVGAIHNQSDFIIPGLSNTLYLQHASGHLHFTGRWADGLAAHTPGTDTVIADTLNWQKGQFGGLAVLGYRIRKDDTSGAKSMKDGTAGGRLSYGVSKNVKLLTELSFTNRVQSGTKTQNLSKGTVAVALSPNTNFWTRPELRVYYSRVQRNAAAAQAMESSVTNPKKGVNMYGIQLETWW